MWNKEKESEKVSESPQIVVQKKLEKYQQKKDFFELIKSLVIIFFACFVVFGLLLGIGQVKGNSMYTTLCDKDLVLLWRPVGEFKRGDIIFFHNDNEDREVVKRIIALPGEPFDIDDQGNFVIHRAILEEEYPTSQPMIPPH